MAASPSETPVTNRRIILKISVGIVGIIIIGLCIIVLQTPPLETTLKQLNDEGFTGAILVADGDKIIHSQGYGWASCDNDVPNTVDTVFAIGSITKMFTAAAVGQLADRGMFSIDDPVGDYLALPSDKASITIRQLLNHTSGLQTYHELKTLVTLRRWIGRAHLQKSGGGNCYLNQGATTTTLIVVTLY